MSGDPLSDWALDREIVLTRVYAHPVAKVFAAWTDPVALGAWYGPDGLAIETTEADIRPGGVWRFDMVGMFEGKEQRFANHMRFLEIVDCARIVVDYGSGTADEPNRFRMTVTFDIQADGKTVVTLRQLHPTPERRHAVIGFGAVEYGMQTLNALDRWLLR